jgi:hypothetical protein
MPDGLTPRATALLVAFVFGVMVCVQALLGGGSTPTRPAGAKQNIAGAVGAAPAAQPELRLVAAGSVPALREPRKPPKPRERRVRKPKRTVRKVVPVTPSFTPAPVVPTATAQPVPVPTATPRYIPPAPVRTPAPPPKPAAPKPTPPPASTPPNSGDFDTTGER